MVADSGGRLASSLPRRRRSGITTASNIHRGRGPKLWLAVLTFAMAWSTWIYEPKMEFAVDKRALGFRMSASNYKTELTWYQFRLITRALA